MHADEVETDVALVRRLLEAQLPEWAELPLERVSSSGTDNALYRLGQDMVVRLPRIGWAANDVDTDAEWLHRIAPLLPVEIPALLAKGAPADGYPWHWGVYSWLEGENPIVGGLPDAELLAADCAKLVACVRSLEFEGGPPGSRATPLADRDERVREAIRQVEGLFDTDAVTIAWEQALAAPAWAGRPLWTHGDLLRGNLLLTDGRLTGVIDWSGLGVGDPACDLLVAWSVLPAEVRPAFRAAVGIDEATWLRGRGWALCVGLLQVPYYSETNPELAGNGRHMIEQVLAEPNIRS